MLSVLAFALALSAQTPDDGPIATAVQAPRETREELNRREAMAYAWPLPEGAPSEDYAFVGWCVGLIDGHVRIGESIPADQSDAELLRLGRLERTDFQSALDEGRSRHTDEQVEAAEAGRQAALARWAPYLENESVEARTEAYNTFFGLPGRCEHAARRIRQNITTPPLNLVDVGLTREEVLPPELLNPQPDPVAEQPEVSADGETAEDPAPEPAPAAAEPATGSVTERLNRQPG
ncbi:hypothetical protein Q0812_09900 [Brevundimonas sp. 2R-24]|uniref:Uncharacterized protein n=1 Tax=Peiella sedimenti TaxID=3061083 RepID=A0ABT8SMF4_9CAUL|nr:hypothetical protein [Caulobacteraceae bacterium XZ-24]